MNILITGALGFVGSNLAAHYGKQSDHKVIGIDNRYKMPGSAENLEHIVLSGCEYCYCDIRNSNDVEKLFEQEKEFHVVFHMAAQVAFKCSVENPRLDFEVNALGTFNLLEAIRRHSPNALFVYASTNQVYGETTSEAVEEYETRYDFVNLTSGVPETYPLDFLSPYGCSKGAGDMYAQDYARVYGLKTVVARFGGIYGMNQYSYEDHGWVSFISKMVLDDAPFNRFGHGKQVRDILFITDIVRAMDLIVEKSEEVKGEVFNISGGPSNTLSVLELISLLEELTGNKQKSIVNPMRIADKLVMYLDIDKAKNILGWQPVVNKREGISQMLEWLRISKK